MRKKRRNERVSTLRRVEKKEMESIGEGCKRTMKSNDKILTKIVQNTFMFNRLMFLTYL